VKVTVRVFTGGTPLTIEPDRIVIDETEGMHDMATIYVIGSYGRDIVSQLNLGDVAANDIGPPAAIEVVSSNVLATFYGYIDTTVETRTTTSESSTEIFFLAATAVMRNGRPRVWRDRSVFDIASELVADYGIGLEIDKLLYPMASFSQSDQSDWEALRNLAILNGLSLTGAGTTVRLKDVINTTRRAKGTALTTRFRRPGSLQVNLGIEPTQFTQVASRTPLGGERYRYYGVDHLGVAFEVSGGVSAIEKSPGTVVTSLGAALREARRHESTGRFVTRATLDGNGIIGCSAGDCIIVDNDREAEYWYVTGSKHTLNPVKSEHRMTLDLCRQEGVSPGYISAPIPQRPGTVLIGKEWRCDRSWGVEL